MSTTEIKSRPILFSGEMVKAILRGDKTQTRRVIKPQFGHKWGQGVRRGDDVFSVHVDIVEPSGEWMWLRCPYGKPGDRLWVRETTFRDGDELYYRADGDCCDQIPECACCEVGKPKCKPSIFMPRDDCRITLEVTDVRVERVGDISDEDVLAEGFQDGDSFGDCPDCGGFGVVHIPPNSSRDCKYQCHTARGRMVALWDKLNSKGNRNFPWESNPWVWVVSFKRIES